MNFTTLKSRVENYLDRNDTNIATLSGQWVNDARAHIATLYNFDHLQKTSTISISSGVATGNLPSDYLDHVIIFNSSTEIPQLQSHQLEDYVTASAGTPKYYIIEGSTIRLFPTPSSDVTLTIRYYGQPSDFSSDSDNDYMSTVYFMTIIFYATMLGALWSEDQRVEAFYRLYERERASMLIREMRKRHGQQEVVQEIDWAQMNLMPSSSPETARQPAGGR